MNFTTVVYDNPEKTGHDVDYSQSAQRLEIYYELMVFIILISAVLFIAALLWLKKKPNLPQNKLGAVKI